MLKDFAAMAGGREQSGLFHLAGNSGKGLLRLLKAEILLAMAEMPQLLALWLILVPLALLAWVGLSVLAGWAAWHYTAELGWAIATFSLLQLLCCGLVLLRIARSEKRLFVPATRQRLRQLRGLPPERPDPYMEEPYE